MKVVITGSSQGIGRAIAYKFLEEGHDVIGLDIKDCSIRHEAYKHHICDVSKASTLPTIPDVDILINNAGTWDQDVDNVSVNLDGTVFCTEEYGLQPHIKSIVNIVSASAHSGAEFPWYVASKGGVLAYTKWTAAEVAKFGATCNSISPGGVLTKSNNHILKDAEMTRKVLKETMLDKWATAEEIAEWTYFISVVNKSMTAQDVLIDNGEMAKFNFIW